MSDELSGSRPRPNYGDRRADEDAIRQLLDRQV
jgi:hypothetical protein